MCEDVVLAAALAADTSITTDAAPRLPGLALVLLARAPGVVTSTGLGPVLVPLPVEVGGGGRRSGGSGGGPVTEAEPGAHGVEDVHETTMRRWGRLGKERRPRRHPVLLRHALSSACGCGPRHEPTRVAVAGHTPHSDHHFGPIVTTAIALTLPRPCSGPVHVGGRSSLTSRTPCLPAGPTRRTSPMPS